MRGHVLGGIISIVIKKTTGVTIMEMLLVLAIIGALTFLGMPIYAGLFGDLKVSGFSRKISTDLREYQQRAINEHSCFVVTLDTVQKYSVYRDEDCDGSLLVLVKTVDLADRPPMQSPNISMDWGAAATITFSPLGAAYGETSGGAPAPMNIVVTAREGKSVTVSVTAATGHVSIQ